MMKNEDMPPKGAIDRMIATTLADVAHLPVITLPDTDTPHHERMGQVIDIIRTDNGALLYLVNRLLHIGVLQYNADFTALKGVDTPAAGTWKAKTELEADRRIMYAERHRKAMNTMTEKEIKRTMGIAEKALRQSPEHPDKKEYNHIMMVKLFGKPTYPQKELKKSMRYVKDRCRKAGIYKQVFSLKLKTGKP